VKKRTKAVLWGLAAALLLLLVAAAAAAGYLYRNPSQIKGTAVRALSRATGYEIRLQTLSWGRDPLRLRLRGIAVTGPGDGLRLAVDSLGAELALEGSLGERTLVIRRAGAQGVDLSVRGALTLPDALEPEAGPSLPARAAAWLVKQLLFEDVRIERADLTRGRAEVRSGPAVLRVTGLEASLSPGPAFEASFEARLRHEEKGFSVHLPRVAAEGLRPENRGAVQGRITVQGGTLVREDETIPGVSLEGAFTLEPEGERIRVGSLEIRLPDVGPLSPVVLEPAPAVRIESSGTLLLGEGRLENGRFSIGLRSGDAALEVRGRTEAKWAPSFGVSVEDLECRFRPEEWIPVLPEVIREPLDPLGWSGPVAVTGGVRVRMEEGGLRVSPDLSLALSGNTVTYTSPPLEAAGVLEGRMRVHGAWPDPAVSGTIRARALGAEHAAFRLPSAEADLRLGGALAAVRLEKAELRAPEVRVSVPEEPLSLRRVRVTIGEGRLAPFSKALRLSKVRLEAEELGPLLLEGALEDGKATLSARGEKTGVLAFLAGQGGPLEGWSPAGDDEVRVQAASEGPGGWRFALHAGVAGLAFENEETEAFGEGMDLSLDAEVRIPRDGPLRLESASLEARAGELLVDRFYLDLKAHPFSVNAGARVDAGAKRISHLEMGAVIGGLLSLGATGSVQATGNGVLADLRVAAPPFSLAPVFRLFVQEPFRRELPNLEEITLEGRASADLRLRTAPGGYRVSGEARIREGGLGVSEPAVSLEGLDLTLPIRYGTTPGQDGEQAESGRLEIRRIRVPFLPEQDLSMPLQTRWNRLRAPGPTTVAVPGGSLRLGPVDLVQDPETGPSVETSLHMETLDLQPFLSTLWSGSPAGRVSGTLTSVRYRQGRVTSQGTLEARVFGGRVILENLGASGLFTASPVYRLEARWRDMNLEAMTAGTAFGRITGLLRGGVENFELAYGQPQRFDLLLETVHREGVEQRISVKAVDNIARIGGGGSPFAGLAGLFTSFFREFPYEKIGVHAVLENDVFRINGTIQEGGTEYLVKRSGFSGVNIVNQNPDNRIRFKDMVKRIQRVTSTEGGPVIR
jgi:hypothetical protein